MMATPRPSLMSCALLIGPNLSMHQHSSPPCQCRAALGSCVLGADMGFKLFVALQLEFPYHLIYRFAREPITRRREHPSTFAASQP
jgi:hypothetical protein